MHIHGGDGLMATVVRTEQRKTKCPCCGTTVKADELGRAGLTPELLEKLRRLIQGGTLEETLIIAESSKRQMDPGSTSLELAITEKFTDGLSSIQQVQHQMYRDIVELKGGTGKGDIAEIMTTERLRQTFNADEFNTSEASKGGTDIIATVFDRKNEVGKISISVKNTKTWKSEYLEQLERNMESDSSKVGILVTSKLPKRTSPTGEVVHNNGVMYFLVHHDHAAAIYASLRQVVIHMHETAQYITSKEQELMRMGQISKALAQWITGDEYREILQTLEAINGDSKDTTEVLQHVQNVVIRDIKKACDKQQRIQQHVLNQESLLKGLNDLLRATDGEVQK